MTDRGRTCGNETFGSHSVSVKRDGWLWPPGNQDDENTGADLEQLKMCLRRQLVDDCHGFLPRSKVRRPCTDHVGHKGEGSCQEGEKIFVESLPGRIINGGRLRVRTFAWARFRLKNSFAYQNEGSGRL